MSKERDALKKAIGIINFTHPNTWHEFILNNVKPKKLTRIRKEPCMQFGGIKRIDSYFNGQRFLNVEVNFETL